MPLTADAVLDAALDILDADGLEGLSMRRVASALGVQPGAIYHHLADKQTMLAGIVDRLLREVPAPVGPWRRSLEEWAGGLRAVLLEHRDSAELVSTVRGFRLGQVDPTEHPSALLVDGGLPDAAARGAASTLLYYVLGHVAEEQARADWVRVHPDEELTDAGGSFAGGLAFVLDGVQVRLARGGVA